jgi:FtsZ-binding cell division protein ZapB
MKTIATEKELKEISKISEVAESLKIKSESDVEKASDTLVMMKLKYDYLEEKRKQYVQPAQETINRINEDFKKITNPLQENIKYLKSTVIDYVKEKKEAIKQEEKKVQKELKDRSLVLRDGFDRVFSDYGELRFKKGYDFKVVNKSKIPDEYYVLDEKKLMKDITDAGGDITIPGIKVIINEIDSVSVYPDREVVSPESI